MLGRGRESTASLQGLSLPPPSHALVAETGIGIENAGRVFLRLLQAGRADAAISLGYCGALTHDAVRRRSDLGLARPPRRRGERRNALPPRRPRASWRRSPARLPIRAGTFLTLTEWMKKRRALSLRAPRHAASRMRHGDVRPGAALPARGSCPFSPSGPSATGRTRTSPLTHGPSATARGPTGRPGRSDSSSPGRAFWPTRWSSAGARRSRHATWPWQ